MKLHLPTKLRAAVIAAMAFFALAPAAQAEYDTTAATYAKIVKAYSTTATSDGTSAVSFDTPVSNLRDQAWTMIISSSGFANNSSAFLQYGDGVFAGSGGHNWLDAKLNYGFGLMLDNGSILIATPQLQYSGSLSSYPEVLVTKAGSAEKIEITLSYKPLEWVGEYDYIANGMPYSVGTDGIKGTEDDVMLTLPSTPNKLSVVDGSVTLTNGNVLKLAQTPEFTSIALPGSSTQMMIRSLSPLPASATTTLTVVLPSDETNWVVTGQTSLQELKAGGFYDDTTGTSHTTLADGDKIYFIGSNGVLFTDEDATLSNQIDATITTEDPMTQAVIGLGAAAGKTLTMEQGDNVLTTADTNGGLKVTGAGTVQLNVATSNELGKLTIDPGATLKINGADTVQTIKLGTGNTSATSHIAVAAGQVKLVALGKQPIALGQLTGETESTILQVEGSGTVNAASVNTAGSFATAGSAKLTTASVQAKTVMVGGISEMNVTGTVTADDISTDEATLKAGSVTAKHLVEGTDAVTIDGKSGAAFTAQKLAATADGVTVSGVQDAVITLTDDTFSSTGATSGTTFKKGTSSIETSSTAGKLDMTTDGLTVAGAVTAGAVTLEDYDLTAGSTLNATTLDASGDSVINVKTTLEAGTLSLGGDATATADTMDVDTLTVKDNAAAAAKTLKADTATLGGTTTLTDAELKDAVVTATAAGFSSLEAAAATIGNGYTLEGMSQAPAAVNITTLTVKDGSSLSHMAVSNTTTIKSSGTQTLNDVVFNKGYAGYTDGSSPIFTVGDTDGLTDLHLTGTVSATTGVALDKIVVNGETIDFTDNADHPTIVTLVTSAAGINMPANYELNITPFVEAIIKQEGDKLVLQGFSAREALVAQLSDTPDRTSAIQAMLEVNDAETMSDELREVFKYVGRQYMFGTTPEDLERSLAARRSALAAAAGSSLANLTDAQRRGIEDVQKNLRNRIVQMGGQEEGLLHGWDKGNVQAWAQGDGAFHTLSSASDAAGYDYDVYGATVGANMDLNEHWTVGAALSAEFGSISGKGPDKLDADTETTYLSLFGRYQKGHWTQMGIFTIGMDDTDTTRRVLDYKAEGSTSGTSFSGYYELGYLMPLDEEVRQLIQPIFNVSLTSAKTDSFTETGSIGNAGLKYDSRNLFYGSVGVGARYQAVLSQSVYERNTVLELRGQVNQHFGDSTDEASVSFIGGGSPYTVHGATSGDFGVQLGAGLTVPVYNQTTLFGDVDGEFRSKQTDFRANIGVRYEF